MALYSIEKGRPNVDMSPFTSRLRWRDFCEQWRHCYLLLVAGFAVIWRISAMPIPKLQNTRIMGGLHPGDVLLLLNMLGSVWVLPLAATVLYAASFAIRRLNTAGAIAVSALCSLSVVALLLIAALIHITVN
jgi:hypothetical protein